MDGKEPVRRLGADGAIIIIIIIIIIITVYYTAV